MDSRTAEILDKATLKFYEQCADSFSDTRRNPWPGWERLLESIPANGRVLEKEVLGVLDLGCGNLRFERFLSDRLGCNNVRFLAIDRCKELVGELPGNVEYICSDAASLEDGIPNRPSSFDLSVAFALLHHIPYAQMRRSLMRMLIRKTKPGGIACVSLWQFAKDPKLLGNAVSATTEGCAELGIELDMDAGDYLMGWQGQEGVYRYCHSFADAEVDELASDACKEGATLLDYFSADGRGGGLNRYIVLKRDVD